LLSSRLPCSTLLTTYVCSLLPRTTLANCTFSSLSLQSLSRATVQKFENIGPQSQQR
jgi:hypothetical protein